MKPELRLDKAKSLNCNSGFFRAGMHSVSTCMCAHDDLRVLRVAMWLIIQFLGGLWPLVKAGGATAPLLLIHAVHILQDSC